MVSSIRSRSNAALLLLAFLAAPAFGQKGKKVDPDEAKARTLFTAGQKAYDVGEFSTALASYTEAYKLKPLPGFLFNIAQCHRQLGNFKEASFFYGRFIDNSKPEAPNVELARELLEDAKRREAEAARKDEEARKAAEEKAKADAPLATVLVPADVPPPPMPPLEEPKPVYTKGWFWGVVGGGVAVVAGAVVAGVLLSNRGAPAVTYPTATLMDIDGRGGP
ncbi:MAG: tetratricopeptide repeat protein [Archangium sp.]|nr:tetratricopeptide repeat protein [Archangium sp.]